MQKSIALPPILPHSPSVTELRENYMSGSRESEPARDMQEWVGGHRSLNCLQYASWELIRGDGMKARTQEIQLPGPRALGIHLCPPVQATVSDDRRLADGCHPGARRHPG